jgi:hypothetical protein
VLPALVHPDAAGLEETEHRRRRSPSTGRERSVKAAGSQ